MGVLDGKEESLVMVEKVMRKRVGGLRSRGSSRQPVRAEHMDT